jgi:hypothetical protein
MTRENFSLEDLNPLEWLKKSVKFLFLFLVQTLLAGVIFYLILHKIGLLDEPTVKKYIIYFVVGAIAMYVLTFIYFAFLCRNNKFDAGKLAKISVLGPSVVLAHVIILVGATFLFDVPEFGPIIYLLVWSTLGVIVVPGILFATGVEIAQKTASCSSLF